MRRARREILLVLVGLLTGTGCTAPRGGTSAFVPQPIEMPSQPAPSDDNNNGAHQPAGPMIEDEAVMMMSGDARAAAATALPVSWSVTFGHTRPFAEVMHLAADARKTFDRAATSLAIVGDAGAPAPKQFERASSLLDQGSRLYAAAYHAPNATMSNRIDTLHDAADMILAWSRKLDEAGLARAPAAYRADPAVALTFEDVANGPAKRWREEGIALLHLCVELARTNSVDSTASRGCASMRQSYARVIVRRPESPRVNVDAGATGCACDPGDPLCSASMSGWCRPK